MAKEERVEQLKRQNETLKQTVDAAKKGGFIKETPKAKFTTIDPQQAHKYLQVGGRAISVEKLHPNQPYRAGKRYGFIETKEELDALVKKAEEEGRA